METHNMLNYKDIFNMITLSFLIADTDKKIIFTNDSCINYLNLDRGKIHYLTVDELFNFNKIDFTQVDDNLALQKSFFLSTQFEHDNKEISEVRLTFKAIRIPMKTRFGYYIEIEPKNSFDFTDQDFVKLGKRTSQIAHEISNPLSVLKIQCDNFALKAKKQSAFTSEDVLNRVKSLSHSSDRINQSNKSLKALSKNLINLEADLIKTNINANDLMPPQH